MMIINKIKPEKSKSKITANLSRFWLLYFTILLIIIFGILKPAFFVPRNLLNILSSACLTGLAGMGITCISAAGEIDFSIGAQVTFSAAMMGVVLKLPLFQGKYILVLLLTLAAMVVFGLINSFLHNKIGIPAFIATMGSSYVLQGIAKNLLEMKTLRADPAWPDCFTFLGQTYVGGIVPISLIILVVVGAAMYFYTEYTCSGRYIFAVGVNANACKYLGIDSKIQKRKGFILCAVSGGVTGILMGSMQNGATITLGDDMLFQALTALMLGATLKKGVYNVAGTILGAVLITIITFGVTMLGAPPYVRDFTKGGILVISVTLVTILRSRSVKSVN